MIGINEFFDIAYIGAGPATMFSVLKLLKNGYKGKIAIIEKGKSIKTRDKNELISGVFGAGTFSDSKITSALDVGGVIPGLTQEQLDHYSDELLGYINEFNEGPSLDWGKTTDFNTKDTGLKWNIHKTVHVGTDLGQKIYYEIEKYINNFPNVELLTEFELIELYNFRCRGFHLHIKHGETHKIIKANKIVLATGQKSTTTEETIKKLKLKFTYRPLQLGIRVEDSLNPQYREIIKSNYDFKFVDEQNWPNGIKTRVRTFCCNSGNAHVCAEKNKEGFICFNGHSYKEPDPTNNTVNYGIMCEVEGLNNYNTKEEQIELMKEINNLPYWESDNFYFDGSVDAKNCLLDGVNILKSKYPKEVIEAINIFIFKLNKLVDLSMAVYYYPEVKLSGIIPELDYNTFETKCKDLYMIGDCCISRGILKAAITGIKFAEHILEEN